MASLDVSAAEGVLKVRYPSMKVKFLGYDGHPLLALLPKDEEFVGKQLDIPLHYGGNQGASRTFSDAQGNKTGGLYEAFNLVRKKDYGLTSIELEAIQASASDAGAFLRMATAEVDNIIRTVGNNLATSLYRNHGGARGQIATSGVSTVTLTLASVYDVVNFEVGMTICSSAADGTSGSVTADGTVITAINRKAGTLTAGANWAGTFNDADYLFREGDFGNSIHGLASWLPGSATPGTLLGVDRNVDVTRLGGIYHDGSTQSYVNAFNDAEILTTREGGNPSHIFMNPADFGAFRKTLGSQCVYEMTKSPDVAQIGFKALMFQGSQNEMKVLPDRSCPQGRAYMLQLDTFKLYSLGAAPKILEGMGQDFIWDYNADSIEIRCGYYANLGCSAPGKNCVVLLPSLS